LRWAVAQANGASEASTINFDPNVFDTVTPQRITLNGSKLTPGDGQNSLELSNTKWSTTIRGPSHGVWVQGSYDTGSERVNHVFWIDEGVPASFERLTIAGGYDLSPVSGGGGMYNGG